MKNYKLITIAMLFVSAFASISRANINDNWKMKSQRSGLQELSTAENLCAQEGEALFERYLYVFCEPTFETKIQRLRWSEVHREKVFAGVVRSTYTSRSNDSVDMKASIRTPFASIFSSLRSHFSSYERETTETPVFEDRAKKIDMYRDEPVQSYGYVLWVSTPIKPNNEPPKELYNSATKQRAPFASYNLALEHCTSVKEALFKFSYTGICNIEEGAGSQFTYKFTGKRAFVVQ